ncbi:hypothetical protein Tco_1128593 [Tanacetum coccineum]
MDPNSSLGKICLGEDVVVISSDKVEGSGDWNSLEFQDTANSGKKKETKGMGFYQMETEEVSDRFMAPCFVNGLEAYDVKGGNKVVKKELIVALRGEIYFVKFIINPEEDDVEPGKPKKKERANHLLDFNIDDIPLLGEEGHPPFICKMGKSSRNKKRAMENLNFFYQDIRTSSSAGGHLTQEEAAKEAIAIRMSRKFALLEEERPIIETMAYHDKYKKILDEVWKDKVEFDGKIVKEEEEALKRIKGEALKEKDDPGAFIFPIRLEGRVNKNALADTGSDINTMPYRIYEQLGREDMKKVGVTTLIAKFLILDIPIDRDLPIVVGRGFLRTIGGIVNTPERLFSTLDGFCHQTFHPTRSDIMRNTKSDSDDEEDYQIKRNKFGAPIYGPKPASYLNCNDLDGRSLAIQTVTNPFRKISVWKKATMGTNDDEAGSSRSKRSRQHETVEEVLLPQIHHEFLLWEGCHRDAKSIMGYDGEINDMLRIRLREAESNEEIFTSFYSTYEFDEVCVDDELQTKKIIKFRLGGRAHSLTLLEFAHRLGLYHADELEEDGFNVYFEGGLRSDEHFNAQDYWLSISREDNLGLSRSHTSTIKKPILRVIHKMITYGLCQRTIGWMKRKGAGTQKESQICCGQFMSKIARKCRVLTEDVVRSLSAPIYCIDLDTTTLRDLIDSDGKLIPEDPQSGVTRVGIPRPLRASLQDLYDRMGRMEICQEAIERMKYRQSYHWDRYRGVFEHMAGVYSILM